MKHFLQLQSAAHLIEIASSFYICAAFKSQVHFLAPLPSLLVKIPPYNRYLLLLSVSIVKSQVIFSFFFTDFFGRMYHFSRLMDDSSIVLHQNVVSVQTERKCLTLEVQGRDATVTLLLQVVGHLGNPLSLDETATVWDKQRRRCQFLFES